MMPFAANWISVPYRIAPHPCDRRAPDAKCSAKLIVIARGDGGEDSGGNGYASADQIGAERNEQADEDLRAGLFSEITRDPVFRHRRRPGDANPDSDTADRKPQKRAERGGCRERTGKGCGDGEPHADQSGRIVQEGLPFKDVHQPARYRHPRSDCGNGNRIGRRDDCCQRKSDGERHRWNEPIDEVSDANDREDDEAEREFKDRRLVAKQTFLRNAPAIEKQQRRQEQQEEDVGFQFDAEIGHRGDERTDGDLNQGQWQSNR